MRALGDQQRAVLAGPRGGDVAGHLGMALHAPGGRADPERLVRVRRRRREQHRVLRAARRSPPSATARTRARAGSAPNTGSSGGAAGSHVDVEHAELRAGRAPTHLAAAGQREQLGAEADAERRHAGRRRPSAMQRPGRRQPGAVLVVGRAPSRRRAPAGPRRTPSSGGQLVAGVRVPHVELEPGRRRSQSPNQPGPVLASCWTTRTRGRCVTSAHSTEQVAVELERRDLAAVVEPLGPLVAQEEVEDVLAERLGDQLAASPSGGSPRPGWSAAARCPAPAARRR